MDQKWCWNGWHPFLFNSKKWHHDIYKSRWFGWFFGFLNFWKNLFLFGRRGPPRMAVVKVFACWDNRPEMRKSCWVSLGVSKNRGTPKSSILIGFSLVNHPFRGTSIFGNTHLEVKSNPWKFKEFQQLKNQQKSCWPCEGVTSTLVFVLKKHLWKNIKVSTKVQVSLPAGSETSEMCTIPSQITYTRRKRTSQCWNGEAFLSRRVWDCRKTTYRF